MEAGQRGVGFTFRGRGALLLAVRGEYAKGDPEGPVAGLPATSGPVPRKVNPTPLGSRDQPAPLQGMLYEVSSSTWPLLVVSRTLPTPRTNHCVLIMPSALSARLTCSAAKLPAGTVMGTSTPSMTQLSAWLMTAVGLLEVVLVLV